jgi:hypothetical protein
MIVSVSCVFDSTAVAKSPPEKYPATPNITTKGEKERQAGRAHLKTTANNTRIAAAIKAIYKNAIGRSTSFGRIIDIWVGESNITRTADEDNIMSCFTP